MRHQFKERILAWVLTLAMVGSLISSLSIVALAAETTSEAAVSITVESYELQTQLVTDHESTTYEGDIVITNYTNTPTAGYQYLILDVEVTVPSTVGSYAMENLTVTYGSDTYQGLDSQFLKDHNYTPITATTLMTGIHGGEIVFEVPNGYEATDFTLCYEEHTIPLVDVALVQTASIFGDTNITVVDAEVSIEDAQTIVDNKIEAALNSGMYTVENPYVLSDPYGRSPLSALVGFQADDVVEVTVRVASKGEYGTVEYTVPTEGDIHMIAVLGLYADYNNQVTVVVTYGDSSVETAELEIQTGTLPNDMSLYEVETLDISMDDKHFTQIGYLTDYNVIVDMEGEVRWYYYDKTAFGFEYLENGHLILHALVTNGYGENSVTQTSILTEIDMLGKIYQTVELNDRMHHEFRLISDDLIAYTGHNPLGTGVEDTITIFNWNNGEIVESIDMNQILDRYRSTPGFADLSDWFHANSFGYDEETDSFVISGRHQGVVMIDSEREIEWILAPHYGWTEEYTPYLLTPVDADGNELYDMDSIEGQQIANEEFFPLYQHAVTFVSNMDENEDTVEIILFDNGASGVYGLNESSGVIYSIDPYEMTVRELWRYGNELGEEFWSPSVSDANLLDSGNMLISSGDMALSKTYGTHIVEQNEMNETVWSVLVDTEQRLWIAEEVSIYPEGYVFQTHDQYQEITVDPSISLTEVPMEHDYDIVELVDIELFLMELPSEKLLIDGVFGGFDFNLQLGFLSLMDSQGNVDVYGFLVGTENKVEYIVDILEKDYVAYQISIVDECAEKLYQSEFATFVPATQLETYTEKEEVLELKSYVDRILLTSTNELYVRCWGIVPELDTNEDTSIKIVLDGENGMWSYEERSVITRVGVTSVHGENTYNYDNSGFDDTIPLRDLPSGVYSVCIEVTNQGVTGYTDTGYYFEITGAEATASTPVPSTDLLTTQATTDATLQAIYNAGAYTLEAPLVIVDPYNLSPLTALAMFETESPATISITVHGLRDGQDISNTFTELTTTHTVPIYGLYSNEATDVTLTATYADGTTESTTISVTGGTIPSSLALGDVVTYDTELMADGLTFISGVYNTDNAYAIDANGDVRWVFTPGGAGGTPITVLENGRLLTNISIGPESYYKYGVQEFDLTGKIYAEYMLDYTHHDCIELPNGNLIVLGGDATGTVIEDTIYELDRETGEILRAWDMDSYFNIPTNEDGDHANDTLYGAGTYDWFHNNSVSYVEADNSLLISGRSQDVIIKLSLTTGEVVWILSDPDDAWGTYLEDKLLTPVGEEFEYAYGQHNIQILDNGDILLFDNGVFRGKTADTMVPAEDSYSRIVQFHVDEENMTVEQVWEYGSVRGSELLARILGAVSYLDEGHYMGHFGGIIKDADGDATYNFGEAAYSGTTIVEVLNDEVIFEYSVAEAGLFAHTYRSIRLDPYTSDTYPTFEEGVRLGELTNYGLATQTTLPTGTAQAMDTTVTAVDNGIHLTLSGLTQTDSMNLYFDGTETYTVPVTATNSAFSLNCGEIPVGSYDLYLEMDGTLYTLGYTWTNTVAGQDIPLRYQIDVVSSNDTMGEVYGEGLYYPNTALSVIAMPEEGYVFTGWLENDVTVSTDVVYSFIPTADTTLTAQFMANPFIDVADDDWFYSDVMAAVDAGLFIGTSDDTFSPEGEMTVKMVSIVLNRISDGAVEADANPLADYGFALTDAVTREGLAVMLYSYALTTGAETATLELDFSDAEDITAWAVEAMAWCVENGILKGTSGTTLDPLSQSTRAQVATVMMRLAGLA